MRIELKKSPLAEAEWSINHYKLTEEIAILINTAVLKTQEQLKLLEQLKKHNIQESQQYLYSVLKVYALELQEKDFLDIAKIILKNNNLKKVRLNTDLVISTLHSTSHGKDYDEYNQLESQDVIILCPSNFRIENRPYTISELKIMSNQQKIVILEYKKNLNPKDNIKTTIYSTSPFEPLKNTKFSNLKTNSPLGKSIIAILQSILTEERITKDYQTLLKHTNISIKNIQKIAVKRKKEAESLAQNYQNVILTLSPKKES